MKYLPMFLLCVLVLFLLKKRLFDTTDILTGKKISNILGDIWTCKDITGEEKYYNLSLLIENDKKETIAIQAKKLDSKYKGYRSFFTVKESLLKEVRQREMEQDY